MSLGKPILNIKPDRMSSRPDLNAELEKEAGGKMKKVLSSRTYQKKKEIAAKMAKKLRK